jgi:peptidase M48-like protein
VNAFAACTENGKAVMAITDGLMEIQANLAQAQATDDIFRTRKVDEYIAFLARNQKPGAPIVKPPPGFWDPAQRSDSRKVARQHEVLDEELGFVLGHELGHHYLGHLPCTAQGNVGPGDVTRVLSGAIPLFNQPNEVQADIAGTNNILDTGKRRAPQYQLTEGGAILTMRFFAGMDQMSPVDVVFSFERTHPPPQLRIPIIQQTANNWRRGGGQGGASPFPFPLPW